MRRASRLPVVAFTTAIRHRCPADPPQMPGMLGAHALGFPQIAANAPRFAWFT
jgi:hypothetical protein